MEPLFHHIERYVKLDDAARAALGAAISTRELKKKETLLKEGQICSANYFVAKGCLRMYYINEKGIEQIVQFGIDGWWLTDYISYSNRSASHFYIQAIEASEVYVLDRQKEDTLFMQVPALEHYFRLLLQRAVGAAQQRQMYMSDFSGEERYYHFCSSFPDFVQRVPQYMLASYLGFTPEFLSKIRAGKV